ncbi:MAG: 4Fe-4S cluster-binding domain-containing protein [Clostridia bacterium]|nr:4Fe-4S cluster-binding domain-containing protein [Clostridia bacterium]
MICNCCPRKCGAIREDTYGNGFCGCGENLKIAKTMLHKWEEPCISGSNGSGAIFFSGCSLRCAYCQNYEISFLGKGEYYTFFELREIILDLKKQGAHNINLVNPTHFTRAISKALAEPVGIPVVYNCGGYENIDELKALEGKIDIYLADFKYSDNSLGKKYSNVEDYPEIALNAVKEMYRQVGDFEIDENGLMKKGLIIRHLILPGLGDNTKGVIDIFSKEFEGKKVMFSLMGQYVPMGKVLKEEKYSEINKKVSNSMYKKMCDYMNCCNIEYGYTQELSSADSCYTPEF